MRVVRLVYTTCLVFAACAVSPTAASAQDYGAVFLLEHCFGAEEILDKWHARALECERELSSHDEKIAGCAKLSEEIRGSNEKLSGHINALRPLTEEQRAGSLCSEYSTLKNEVLSLLRDIRERHGFDFTAP